MSQSSTQGDLQSRSLLVDLCISQWNGRKLDKKETRDVVAKHTASEKAVRVTKSLMPKAKELTRIHEYSREIQAYMYKNTLPWETGQRIMSTDIYLKFAPEVGSMMAKWRDLVDDFVLQYYTLIEASKSELGTLFDFADYPTNIGKKFSIRCDYKPVPDSKSWILELSDDHVESLRKSVTKATEDRLSETMRHAWQKLFDVAEHMTDRLSDPKNVFKDSSILNAKQTVTILKDLNFTNDKNLETLRRQLEKALSFHTPDDFRKDLSLRKSTADNVRNVMTNMSAFMGA